MRLRTRKAAARPSKIALAAPFNLSLLGLISCLTAPSSAQADDKGSILAELHSISTIASTVPANGDVNPYGVARVPRTIGRLRRGHILVSNFNNANNLQGTGTTIVDVAPNGTVSLFAQLDAAHLPGSCPGGIGLTTALVVLQAGWVVVGSLPTTDGTSATAKAGCLIVLDNAGEAVETFSGGPINGPWDMTATDHLTQASLLFTNVLNGTVAANGQVVDRGTVVRMDLSVSSEDLPAVQSIAVIASGFPERTDPAALVIGPTGLALSRGCDGADDCPTDERAGGRVLYVADTVGNRIAVVPRPLSRTASAGTGTTLTSGGHLNAPLGLVVAEDGHILTVNAGNGVITEITPGGMQIAAKFLDRTGSPPGAGTLFGLTVVGDDRVYFVDDGSNTLNLLH